MAYAVVHVVIFFVNISRPQLVNWRSETLLLWKWKGKDGTEGDYKRGGCGLVWRCSEIWKWKEREGGRTARALYL